MNVTLIGNAQEPRKASMDANITRLIITPIYLLMWAFTVGICDLGFWRGCFALVAWPYYLGQFVRNFIV